MTIDWIAITTTLSKKPCGLPTAGKRNLRKKAEVGGQSFLFLSNYSKADTALHHKVSSDEVENFCTGISSFSCHGEDLCEAVKLVYIYIFSSTSLLLPTHLPTPSGTHAQSCNPMDFSPPDSSVRGFFQARILEWVAISFSKNLVLWL